MNSGNFAICNAVGFLLLLGATTVEAQDYDACSSYQSGADLYVDRVEPDGYVECSVTPDVARITVHELSLCTDRPSPDSVSSCVALFTSEAGRTLEISPLARLNLLDEISLPDGTYTHALFRLSNQIALKAEQTFSFDVTGGGGTGRTCSTNGVSGDGNITCGLPGNSTFSTEVVSFLGMDGEGDVPDDGDGIPEPIFFFQDIPSSTNRPFDAYVLNAAGDISELPNDSTQLMIAIELEAATKVSAATESIDIGFKASDMAAFALTPCDPNVYESNCVEAGFIAGFGFYARAE